MPGGYGSGRYGDGAITILAAADRLSVFEGAKRGDAFLALGGASRCWRL